MPKYVLVYRAGAGMADTEPEREEHMAAWGEWFGQVGKALVDGGSPFADSASVGSDGSVSRVAPSGLTGYSIVSAQTLEQAGEIAKTCPIVTYGGTIDVYETLAVAA